MKKKLLALLIAPIILGAYIYAQDVPLNLQCKLMLKIISMDRNFGRFGDPIKIGVSSGNFLQEINSVKGSLKIKGIEFIGEKINSLDDIAKYKVVYIGREWANNYLAASARASRNKALMFCETEAGVMSGGGAVSFKVVEGKPKIIVNLENSRNQGTEFPANFLKITVVVGGLE